jgi:NitT/TauT family transport system substrate-binding protein
VNDEVSIGFSRRSAFYAPLIAAIEAGFLREEGFEPTYSVASGGRSAMDGILDGTVDVCQSAPSHAFRSLEVGGQDSVAHFAQINEMDGFFIVARTADSPFSSTFAWDKLKRGRVLVDHGYQPLAMLKYACCCEGLNYQEIEVIRLPVEEMDQAFRKGQGDYIHLQGPAAQQLEQEGIGSIVTLPLESVPHSRVTN